MTSTSIPIVFLIIFLLAVEGSGQGKTSVHPFTDGERWGYIDIYGKTKIEPVYLVGQNFQEGMAAVRISGTYGYINSEGHIIIPPRFDYALPFENGTAKVYIEGKPYIIDKNGEILFQHSYKSVAAFGLDSTAIVETQTGKFGIVDKKGKLVLDTIFGSIEAFSEGYAVVNGLKHDPYSQNKKRPRYEAGVIDRSGRMVVQYGMFKSIGDYKNGLASVKLIKEVKTGKRVKTDGAFIDTAGNIRFLIPEEKWDFGFAFDRFRQNLTAIEIYAGNLDTLESGNADKRNHFMGALNTKGKIVFSDSSWDELTPFSCNRAFVKATDQNWYLINPVGKKITNNTYRDILFNSKTPGLVPFEDNQAYVKTSEGHWVIIDTNGHIKSNIPAFNFEYSELSRYGSYLVFKKDESTADEKYPYRYGFYNCNNAVLVKPVFSSLGVGTLEDSLIYVGLDNSWGYINQRGDIIWKGKEGMGKPAKLNIDFMNRGYYYASSPYNRELAHFGGWGGSNNGSKPIDSPRNFPVNQLSVFIDTARKAMWANKFLGVKIFVSNTTLDTFYFDAQDSRLYMKMQALDHKGIWRDIEYLPQSWCGNSYHQVYLAPNAYWEFNAPDYQGELKTKLRVELLYKTRIKQKESVLGYSNIIDGYVNPGQLWRKRGYNARGIMDPYND